jgi:hypothetical protein
VLASSVEQAREYARGWASRRATDTSQQLDVYVAVAFGPLRWIIVNVPVDDIVNARAA